jgi:hypothetical protein
MNGGSREDYEVVEEPEKIRFLLPLSAKDQKSRVRGLVFVGLLTTVFFLVSGFLAFVLFQYPRSEELPVLIVGMLLLMCLVSSLTDAILAVSFVIMLQEQRGTDELILTSQWLQAIHRLGPIRWSTSALLGFVEKFKVVRQAESDPGEPLDVRHSLKMELAIGDEKELIAGYPRALLLALAQDLSIRCKRFRQDLDDDIEVPMKRPVIEDSEVPTEILDRIEKPSRTSISVEFKGDGIVFTSPVLFTHRGMFRLLMICAASGMGGIVLLFLTQYVAASMNVAASMILCLSFGCGVFLLMSIFMVYMSHHWKLTITPSRLILEQESLLWKKKRMWDKRDIEKLGVSTVINGFDGDKAYRTTLQLIPHPRRQERTGRWEPKEILSGPTKSELEWISTTIRQVLDVPGL